MALKRRQSGKVIVVDSSCICHIQKNKLGNLHYDHVKTGILFGFLRTMETLFTEFRTNKFAFAWDSPNSERKKMYPGYKANRKKEDLTKEEKEEERLIYEQFNEIRDEILPSLGFKNVFLQRGYEADDLMHKIVTTNKGPFVMVTTDHDMFQSLSHCTIFNPMTKKLYTKEDLYNGYGVTPYEWGIVKSLAGCKTDNVKGIQGVGEKKAAQYITGNMTEGVIYKRIVSTEGQAIAERNEDLVCLPLKGTTEIKLRWDEEISLSAFIRMCDAYGFVTFMKKLKLWKKTFNMR